MIPEDDLELGQLRLLEVDNRVVVPAKTHLRDIIKSPDVFHSWAVPSLGVKCDAVPGHFPSPSNWTSWFVVLIIFFLDTILLFLGHKPFFSPFTFSECAGTPPEEGAGSSNPLSAYKPSQASLDTLSKAIKLQRQKEFPPVTSTLVDNENLVRGCLNSLTATLNSYLDEWGYKKVHSSKIEQELLELKKDNVGLDSFCFNVLGDLSKNKEESLLFKSLLSKGKIKKSK